VQVFIKEEIPTLSSKVMTMFHPHLNPPPIKGEEKKEWIPACARMTYRKAGKT